MVRSITLVAAGSLVMAACGSADDAASETVSLPSTTASPTTTQASAEDDIDGNDDDDRGADDSDDSEMPVAPPEDDQIGVAIEPQRRLSIEDSLLPEDAFPPPWEAQRRNLDRTGYANGPNQTDCDPYWDLDALFGADGGHAMWWVDGGNANHYVTRMSDDMAVLERMLSIATLAESCPVVSWGEGGSFTTEMFEFDRAIAFRFVTEEVGEMEWVILTALADLASVLHIPLWTRADDTMIELSTDEIERLGNLMYEQLERADPAEDAIVVPTTEPPVVSPPPVTDPPVEPTGLGALLLTQDELPAGWELDDVEPYTSSPTDDELIATCPAAESIDRVDVELDWEAQFSSDVVGTTAFELIGEMPDAGTAEAAVREFSTVWECDFTVVIDDATTTGGLIDVAGADLAGLLVIEAEELLGARLELVLAAFGPVVVVVSQETAAADPWSLVDGLLPPAFAKIAASG